MAAIKKKKFETIFSKRVSLATEKRKPSVMWRLTRESSHKSFLGFERFFSGYYGISSSLKSTIARDQRLSFPCSRINNFTKRQGWFKTDIIGISAFFGGRYIKDKKYLNEESKECQF